jgi:hypothetical protein
MKSSLESSASLSGQRSHVIPVIHTASIHVVLERFLCCERGPYADFCCLHCQGSERLSRTNILRLITC